MPLPIGIKTREVTFGPLVDFLGSPVGGYAIITPSQPLIWSRGSVPLLPNAFRVDVDAFGVGLVRLPCTDQEGFVNQGGEQAADWTYRAAFYLASRVQPRAIVFTLPELSEPLDLFALI